MQVRLQKVIAASGLASRRKAEQWIEQGCVSVNGQVVKKMGVRVDPATDHVKVNGRSLRRAQPDVFIMLHKPSGVVTSMEDPAGRPTIMDLLNRVPLRVFPVGRLDFDSEGLLLLTNHGQIAQACLHPKFHVPKTYLVKVSGQLTEAELATLAGGVELGDGMTKPCVVKKSGKAMVNSWIEMTIYEGRTHQVKRMLEAIGHRVIRLRRIRFGPLALGDLAPGAFRYVTDGEANALRALLKRKANHGAQPSRAHTGASGRPPRLPIGRVTSRETRPAGRGGFAGVR